MGSSNPDDIYQLREKKYLEQIKVEDTFEERQLLWKSFLRGQFWTIGGGFFTEQLFSCASFFYTSVFYFNPSIEWSTINK